jgi:hypothetical protein
VVFEIIKIYLAISSHVSSFAFTFGSVVSEANSIIFARFKDAISMITKSSFEALSTNAREIISCRDVYGKF